MNENRTALRWLTGILLAVLLWSGCGPQAPTPTTAPAEPTPTPTAMATLTAVPTAVPPSADRPLDEMMAYSLGETTIVQSQFSEDSRFRNMPVTLDGVIGVPGGDGQRPVVLIIHGNHPGCPADESGEAGQWPCDPEQEQRNYEGWSYLVEALADAGYVALAINVNAEYTLGFGEPRPTDRLTQLIDLHLSELARAGRGESTAFGVDVAGRVDLSRLVWLGHSQGGELGNRILRDRDMAKAHDEVPYGPVQGLVQVAPSLNIADSVPAVDAWLATVLPACDGDVSDLAGQRYYESARPDTERRSLATSVYLEGADHNGFNTLLASDTQNPGERPDCAPDAMLSAEDQRDFLVQYVTDLLQALYGDLADPSAASQRMGVDPSAPPPSALYGYPARVNVLHPAARRLTLLQPQTEGELSTNLLGGAVGLEALEAQFCPEGYYVPANQPGTEPCKRVNYNQPGFPQQFVVGWQSSDAALRTSLPEARRDLSGYAALHLRAALDPLSGLNPQGQPQSLAVELVDGTGARAQVVPPPGIAALGYPVGIVKPNDYFEGGMFTGHVLMTSIVVPMAEFGGIDLSHVTEVALLFDQTETGTLFLADLEFVAGE